MQQRYPSLKSIEACGVDTATARKIKVLFTASREYIISNYWRADQDCRLSLREARLWAIDSILGTHGVEHADTSRRGFDYCNAGDCYALTILYCEGRFRVGTWGDIVERDDCR